MADDVGYPEVEAAGTLIVSEKGDDKAVVKGIVEGLERDGHFAVNPK